MEEEEKEGTQDNTLCLNDVEFEEEAIPSYRKPNIKVKKEETKK